MSSRRERVLIEFTKDVKESAERAGRSKGERLLVDSMSAASLVKKGLAKKVTDKEAEKADESDPAPDQPGVVGGAG